MIYSTKDIYLDEGKSLYVVPFGDIQSDGEYARLGGLVNWLLAREAEGHRVLMFGMGDYFEAPSPSDRAALRAAKRGFGLYEELARDIEQIYVERTKKIASYLEPMNGRIAGFLRGHHWLDLVSEGLPKDTNRLLAQLLDAEYWGSTVLLTIKINDLPFKILASHGYGSARTPGARLAKRIRMRDVYLTANWYCQGHDNDKVVYPVESITDQGYFKQYFSGTGSFQRSYNLGEPEGTYAEDLLLPPSALGVVIAIVKIKENGLDYHLSA